MESLRQQKVARLIQKEMADIFLKEGKNYFGSAFITVTTARISPDLSFAKVYLSLFGAKDKKILLETIKEYAAELRGALGKRVGKQLRITPEINFYIDDSFDYAEKIDTLLKKK